ncbi:MAG: HYExAFE family protein [Planctomycetes bacterium]|nr:HYExAFE family protein [Planctomycetota bacterium]
MTRRHIHYEAAFEDYLRSRGQPYVAVDEQRKAIFAGSRVKSFDFLVYRETGQTWLVDVKGRQFPYHHEGRKRHWENWITREDIDGLSQWQSTFGEGFVSMLVFAYHLTEPNAHQPTHHIHPFRDCAYAFMCVSLDEYKDACRERSAKWDTVSVATARFKAMVQPIQCYDANREESCDANREHNSLRGTAAGL